MKTVKNADAVKALPSLASKPPKDDFADTMQDDDTLLEQQRITNDLLGKILAELKVAR